MCRFGSRGVPTTLGLGCPRCDCRRTDRDRRAGFAALGPGPACIARDVEGGSAPGVAPASPPTSAPDGASASTSKSSGGFSPTPQTQTAHVEAPPEAAQNQTVAVTNNVNNTTINTQNITVGGAAGVKDLNASGGVT